MTFPSLFSSPIIICGFYTYGFSQQTGWTATVQAWTFKLSEIKQASVDHFKIYYLFIFGCEDFSRVAASGGRCLGSVFGPSLRWRLLLGSRGSGASGFCGHGSRGVEHRFNSCGPWARLLQGMWDLPGLGVKVMSPSLAGGLLTTGPPGQSLIPLFQNHVFDVWPPYCYGRVS